MNISVKLTGTTEIVFLSGALTNKSHHNLKNFELPFDSVVLLDVSGITETTSGGIRALVHLHRFLCETNLSVSLCGSTPEFDEMLWLTGFRECLTNKNGQVQFH